MKLISWIKNILNPPWDSSRSKTKLNILTTFGNFKPHGNQNYKTFIPLVIKNINETIPAISKIVELSNQKKKYLLIPNIMKIIKIKIQKRYFKNWRKIFPSEAQIKFKIIII